MVFLAAAIAASSSTTHAQSSVPIPRGFKVMCIDHPEECRGGGAATVAKTPELMATLSKVNREVNRRIRPIRQEIIDVWSVNVAAGDCEEYVLAKRRALIELGVAPSALRIVYALRNRGGHALLAVSTSEGFLILDNRTSRIRALDKTPYEIVSMSGPNPKIWQRV